MDKLPRPNPTVPRVAAGALAAPSAPPPGATWFLGRYRIVDTIGVGGMATVHLARVDGVGGFQKWVAIKRIHADMTEDDQFVRMFLDEARIAASISHPNVAQVFELGQQRDAYWIAMEYLHGEPLRETMRVHEETGVRMSPDLAARIVADAAEGLHAAHELRGKDGEPLNLVHRDVTPHNLFVTYDGTVKVVDFGIAKVAGRLSSTMAGTLKGKIAYMSPEQIFGKEVDRRADIFSLGVVLWELSTGQRLFRSNSEAETLGRVRACIVPTPSMIVPSYPAELESIVMRALSKDRNARQDTARELSRSLQQYLIHAKSFVGSEEISEHMARLFGDRMPQRDERLRWAAEVTNTRSLQQMTLLAQEASARAAMDTCDEVPPATRRDAVRMSAQPEVTGSVTDPMPKRKDPLLQTRRERAVRDAVLTVPDPPIESAIEDDLDEPPTMIATAARAPRPAGMPSRAQVVAAPARQATADATDEGDDDGDTVVVSEAEMRAAMRQRGASASPPASDDDDDDDELPTMAISPDRMPMGVRRAIAAPGLQVDRAQRAPAPDAAVASQPRMVDASAARSAPRAAAARVAVPGPVHPGELLSEALAQASVAMPAVQAVAPAAVVQGAAPQPSPLVPASVPLPIVRPAMPSDALAFDASPMRAPFASQDLDADFYARQRSRRMVILAAVLGGFFVLLGALVLVWSLARG